MVLDLHRVGGIVQQISGLRLDLPHDVAAGFQVGQGNEAPFVGTVLAVGIADDGAVRPGNLENHIRQRLLCGGIHFLHQKSAQGHIGEGKDLRVGFADDNGLRSGVQQVAVNGFDLRHNIGIGAQLAEVNLPVFIGGVEAVAGSKALIVGDQLAIGGGDLELDAGKGLARHAVGLADQEAPFRSVRDHHGLRVAIGSDDHVLAGFVHDIPGRGLDLRQHIRAGGKVGNADFTAAVRLEDAALRQRGCSNHAVQANFTASGGGDTELRAGEGLARNAVPLLHNQFSGGLVLEGERYCPALLDLDGL